MLLGLVNPQQYNQATSYRLNAPLTMAYLARRLADHDIDAEAIDLGGLQEDENFVLEGLDEFDAIGITALSSQAEGARRLLRLIRHHRPKVYIACGGADVTLFPQKYLDWGASCAVVGQADGNVHEVFTKQPSGVIQGKPGPISGRPLWEMHRPYPWQYPGHPNPLALPEAIVMSSRGCPHHCTFCGNVVWNNQRVRYREVDDVADELNWLKGHGVRGIFEYSDEIVSVSSLPFLLSLLQKVDGLVYRAQGRCNLNGESKPILGEIAARGLKRVMWGVESFSDKVLDAMNKHLSPDSIMATLDVSRKAGIENFVFLMAGMPGETPAEAQRTFDGLQATLKSGLVQKVQVTACTPMPGTAFHDQAKHEGWLFPGEPFQDAVNGGTPWMSQAEIAKQVQRLRMLAASYHAL